MAYDHWYADKRSWKSYALEYLAFTGWLLLSGYITLTAFTFGLATIDAWKWWWAISEALRGGTIQIDQMGIPIGKMMESIFYAAKWGFQAVVAILALRVWNRLMRWHW